MQYAETTAAFLERERDAFDIEPATSASEGVAQLESAPDGMGFGLAIVADIAAVHGREVSATDSELGGARFEITGVGRET
nr:MULTISPECIES: hypothetical protein [unclassified Haloarcula]